MFAAATDVKLGNVIGHLKTEMRKNIYLLTIFFLVLSCNQKDSTTSINKTVDIDTIKETSNKNYKSKKLSFKNIAEIVADESSSIWVKKEKNNFSLALHFQYKDTLAISYSPECWLMYPYKVEGRKIIVYWDNNIDTKYDFDIVKVINNTNKKYLGKPFMTLELINDTTLKTNYQLKELINRINRANKERIFFPDRFNLVQEDEMYD